MGLIKALTAAGGSVLQDQWKELFYCDSLEQDVLMVRGKKQTGKNSSNHGNDNIITKGSMINVADGQCAMIVDNGQVVELVAEPGSFIFDDSTEPTIFCGDLKGGIKDSWETFKKRFTFGGDVAHDQRIYFFNTKEMPGNKFGTPNPIPFRAVDRNIGLDLDTSLKCSGVYSLKLSDPIVFYKGLAGNVKDEFRISDLNEQLRAEFMQALQPAIGKLSQLELRPYDVPSHVDELTQYMNEALTPMWGEKRGFEVVSIALNPVILPEGDQEIIKNLQKAATMRDPNMAAANIAAAQADAMRTAAGNEAGAMNGFVGMGMAMNAGSNAANLFSMGQANQQAQVSVATESPQTQANPAEPQAPVNPQGAKFCMNCGNPIPEGAKFCPNCGAKLQ